MNLIFGEKETGTSQAVRIDDVGRLETTLGTRLAGEDLALDRMQVSQAFNAVRITGSSLTTTVKDAPGIVARVLISAGVSAGTISIVDNNNVLAVIPAGAPSFIACELGIKCNTSIVVVRSSQQIELTVVYL